MGALSLALASTFSITPLCPVLLPAHATEISEQISGAKIEGGGASTLQSGRRITITRGVNLDNSDWEGRNLKGVAFQQSVVRKANFKNANLFSASFFDADLSGADFEGADMQQCNLEMADLTNANLKSADLTNAYAAAPCTKALECRAHSCARLHSLHTSTMPVRKCVSHASG